MARAALWRDAHREQIRAQTSAYGKAHPEVGREKMRRRRTLIAGNGPVDRISEDEIFARDGERCHICGKPVRRDQMSLDHIVPIALGGSHTMANVRLAHRRCNYRRAHRGAAQLLML
jgi:5-methylcytosine-specific restriction endonuclease McrA